MAIRFREVSFEYSHDKVILDEASFTLRRGEKITLMGQNGAGKTTLLNLIAGKIKGFDGSIYIDPSLKIAYAKQMIPKEELELNVREFFAKEFSQKVFDLDFRIENVLKVVNLKISLEKKIKEFSGGQKARLLLAGALIQDPDLLILDEPTNNLDVTGIAHLTEYLMMSNKTCIVISHDANFLNSFTDGVIYLNIFTHKIEKYLGDYFVVVSEIEDQIEKERRKNAQYEKEIISNKEKANFFSHKGGKMRLVARKMREKAEAMEDSKVTVRREDKAIKEFKIPSEENLAGKLVVISSLKVIKDQEPIEIQVEVSLQKNEHLLLSGPNGIGKTTLLESLVSGENKKAKIAEGVKVGYYRQDFSNLNFEETVRESLASSMEKYDEEEMRKVAAGFLIDKKLINLKIKELSEGQKGLLSFAKLVLQKPGVLILDEPTNHINFRHIPVLAKALSEYKGAMILVSHVPEFVFEIRIDEELDLGKRIPN